MDVEEPTLDVFFSNLEDPRIDRTKKYPLGEIILLVICGTLCGADSWSQIVMVGEYKLAWLRKFFPYEHGIPSHDTVGRVFSLLNPHKFQECFLAWVRYVSTTTEGEIIAIDGKKSCASADSSAGTPPLYLVNAWAVENGVSFGQIKVSDKSNEITAIPKLLELLDAKGATITIDAIGAQKDICEKVIEQKADYVIGLKANQPNLHSEALAYFEAKKLEMSGNKDFHIEDVDSGHGRVETRNCYHLPIDRNWVPSAAEWKGLASIIAIVSERHLKARDTTTTETRLYISSLLPNPAKAQKTVRSHWSVENQLHYSLDITFDDDRSRIRKDHAPENYNMVKKWVLSLLKKTTTKKKMSLKAKRMAALVDTEFLDSLWRQGN